MLSAVVHALRFLFANAQSEPDDGMPPVSRTESFCMLMHSFVHCLAHGLYF